MFVCKWCRSTIKLSVHRDLDPTLPHWIHTTGLYTCPRAPENLAYPADTRWETVYASITREDNDLYRFEITLQYYGQKVGVVHRIPLDHFASGHQWAKKQVLDTLVREMDKAMELSLGRY